MWRVDGIILSGENRSSGRKTSPTATNKLEKNKNKPNYIYKPKQQKTVK